MKTVRRIAIAIVLVLLFLQFGLGFVVKRGAQTVGSALLGCDVSIATCRMGLVTGVVDMRNVVVGPPEGFDANLFELERLRVDFSPLSLFGDGPFLIREIAVTNALVSYELKGVESNVSAVLDKLGAGEEGSEETEGTEETEEATETAEAEDKPAQEGKGVVIERFVFSGAKVRAAFWDGKGIKPTLPTVELTDIGKSSGGATAAEAAGSVFSSIGKGVIGLVADLGGAVADAVGDAAGVAADVVGDKLGDAADAVGDKLGDAAGAVGDAVGGLFGD